MKKIVYLCLLLFSLEGTAQSRQPIPIPYSDGHLWGLTNGKLEVIATPQFDTSVLFSSFSKAAIASKNKKYGMIDRSGNTVIPFTYDKIAQLTYGFGSGSLHGKKVLINLDSGKTVSPVAFDSITGWCGCDNQLFIVSKGNKKIIISGITGKQLGKATFDKAKFFKCESLQAVLVKTGGKFGLIDTETGAWILPAKYDRITSTEYNYHEFIEVTAGGKSSWFDSNGNPVKKEELSKKPASDSPDEGWQKGVIEAPPGKYLYIDNQGNNNWKLSVEIRHPDSNKVFQIYYLKGYTNLDLFEWFDREVNPATLKAEKDGKTGLITVSGRVLVPFIYDNIEWMYPNDILKTTLDNKEGVLSSSFYEIRKPVFKKVFGQDSEFKLLHIEMPDGKQGFMDKKGKIYIPGVSE